MTVRPRKMPDNAVLIVPAIVTAVINSNAKVESSTKASRLRMLFMRFSGVSCVRRRKTSTAPPAANASIRTRKSQPMGDWLKAGRRLKIPLRVRNVAKLHSPKVAMASETAVFLKAPRYCHVIIT